MDTLKRFYSLSLIFTVVCLGLGLWYGLSSTGSAAGAAELLWIIFVVIPA